MRKTAAAIVLPVVLLTIILLGASTIPAQAPAPTNATDVTAAQIAAFFKTAPPDKNSDRAIRVVDAGPYHVGISGVFRPKSAAPTAIIHQTKVSEVYYMVEGAGTLVTGGTLRPPLMPGKSDIGDWTDVRGAGIDGGTSRRIAKGDIVVIPGGVPHMWASQENDITYLIVRPDPDKQMPLQ